jgi:hypothetical protein
MESAKTLLKRHGFDETSANIIDLQASIDKTIEDDTRNVDFRDEVLFEIPKECEPAFVDMRGDPPHQIFFATDDGGDGSEWAYFWLNEKKKKALPIEDVKTNRPIVRLYRELRESHT